MSLQKEAHGDSSDDQGHQPGSTQHKYTLLNELTLEQQECHPKELIFGQIICNLEDIHSLGINLGFTPAEIKVFESYSPESLEAQALEMLVAWREKYGEKATVGVLVRAMEKSNIPEDCYREGVLDYFRDSDSDD